MNRNYTKTKKLKGRKSPTRGILAGLTLLALAGCATVYPDQAADTNFAGAPLDQDLQAGGDSDGAN